MTTPNNKSSRMRSIIESIYSLFFIVIGIVFLTTPDKSSKVLPYVLFAVFMVNTIYLLFMISQTDDKKLKAGHIIGTCVNVLLALLVITLGVTNQNLITITMALYIIIRITESVHGLIRHVNDKKKFIENLFKIVLFITLLIGLFLEFGESLDVIVTIFGATFTMYGLVKLFSFSNSKTNGRSLSKVLAKSHTFEILSGLCIVIVIASLILPDCETSIKNFGDGLWYCFMIVTTIGFGDITAVTPLGRIISVIVGIYGIVVTALITSILVNLYNENKNKMTNSEEKESQNNENKESQCNENKE